MELGNGKEGVIYSREWDFREIGRAIMVVSDGSD
jgi:hypothetical protein